MEGLRGQAANIQVASTAWVQGGGSNGNSSVTGGTDHICTFQIGTKTVRVTSPDPPVIQAGDEIVVAGKAKRDGIFHARYYFNLSRGIQHSPGSARNALFLGCAMIAGPLALMLVAPKAGAGILFFAIVLGLPVCCYEANARRVTTKVLQKFSREGGHSNHASSTRAVLPAPQRLDA